MANDTKGTVYYGACIEDTSGYDDMCPDLNHKGNCQINIFCGGKDKKHNEENCQINIFCDHDALKKFNNKDDGKCHINILCGCNVD